MVELAEDEEQVDPIANIVYLIDYREPSTERGQHSYQREGLQLLSDTKTVMKRFGLTQVQCDIAIEYDIHISSLLFDLSKEEKKDIDIQDAVCEHFKALLEALTVRENIPLSEVIQALKEDAEFKLIPLIMPELSDEKDTKTWIEKRKAHQEQSLDKMAVEKKNYGQEQTFLDRYRTETEFVRRWASVIAEEKRLVI